MAKCQRGQPLTLGKGESAVADRGQHAVIPGGSTTTATLGWFLAAARTIDGPADVDLLDAFVDIGAGVHGLGERVKVDHHQFERGDPELFERRGVLRLAQVCQQPGVHPRVQCLDPAVEHLREAGHLFDRL